MFGAALFADKIKKKAFLKVDKSVVLNHMLSL